jgi:hypothetical protein
MGCGILYRMVAERIGLCATLATRRTNTTPVPDNVREWQSSNNVTSNIEDSLSCAATREEIKELQRQGIAVDQQAGTREHPTA